MGRSRLFNDGMGKLRKWYFCVNEAGFDQTWSQIRLAVRSARATTDLIPICIYGGNNSAHIGKLEAEGATVRSHQSRLTPILSKGYGDKFRQFSGHWLRLDIPMLEQDDDVVLYTDIDVMFRKHPSVRRVPRYLAAAPERYRWRWPHFNSGVLLLNLPGMRAIDAAFVASVQRRMEHGWKPPGHDQVSYNSVFRFKHGHLPHIQNWKPYWGWSENAEIVHFHGPKLDHVKTMSTEKSPQMMEIYYKLYGLNPKAYAAYGREAALYD